MKTAYIGIPLIILVAIGAFFAFKPDAQESVKQDSRSTSQEASTQAPEPEDQPVQTGGTYADYSEQVVADAEGKKIVIFFHADWCPNCRQLEKTLQAGAIPDDIVILKADYDKETELKKKYGVTQQTTMVQVDSEGKKINIWVANAFDDINKIKEQLS